jgi:hypothetical protein
MGGPVRRRHVAVAVVSALVAVAGSGTSAQGAPGGPSTGSPGECHGLTGQQRARCQRQPADIRKCERLRKATDPFCTVVRLAGDETLGRDNGTPGSALARSFLIDQLKRVSQGLNRSASGDAAYTQPIPGGTNILSVIRGTDLADQYVVVGAHYDHLGVSCRTADPADRICNGATDDAAGVAAVLSIAQAIADQPTRPRRSVIFALWDEEEDGLLGSQYFVFSHPLVPLDKITAYVNFDIQGANLLPSLRTTTFAVGAESGGSPLQNIVRAAAGRGALDTAILSTIFGQGRSDHATFQGAGVPSVFFTDATGPCYHTAQDEIGVVDFGKLDQQISTALDVTRQLAQTSTPPVYAFGTPPGHPAFIFPGPLATYGDAVAISGAVQRALVDLGRFSAADQATVLRIADELARIVADGPAAFGPDDVGTVISDAAALVLNILPKGECSGFLAP